MNQRRPVDLMTVGEAAAALGCTGPDVDRLIEEEDLTVYLVGRAVHLDRGAVVKLATRDPR